MVASRILVLGNRSMYASSGLRPTSCLSREPLDRLPEDVIDIVDGYMDVPPENMLSLPTMEGDIVEKVVPLFARDDIDGACPRCALRFDEALRDVPRLLVDIGLAILARSRCA